MKRARTWISLATLATAAGSLAFLPACGVSKADFDAKVRQAEASAKEGQDAKKEIDQLKTQLATDDQQISQLKGSLGLAQAQVITDDQKNELEEAKRAVQEAQERGKLLDDLQTKFKKMIDAGRLKVTTRHGRIVLQLPKDTLF